MGIVDIDRDQVVERRLSHPSQAPELLGKEFVTPYFQMDAERVQAFEYSTYLDSYAHPYGGEDGYGDDLVEGFHLLGMLDYLCNLAVWSDGPFIPWNYGLDKVRFVSVVRFSDLFRVRGVCTEVVDCGEQGHLLVNELVGEVRGREKPGFTAVQRVLWTTHE